MPDSSSLAHAQSRLTQAKHDIRVLAQKMARMDPTRSPSRWEVHKANLEKLKADLAEAERAVRTVESEEVADISD